MSDRRPVTGWRATVFGVALMAITLNFLQPLVHTALMRAGAPADPWTLSGSVFCNAAPDAPVAAGANTGQTSPLASDKHACCLGLAHGTAFTAPDTVFTAVNRVATIVRPLPALELFTSVGIRDGPYRLRGPPSFV
jgi:hypothetical protein